jgi:predicted nuclease with TOPRIM domain
LRSQLQATRAKSAARLAELEKLKKENEELDHTNQILLAHSNASAAKLRLLEEEKQEMEEKYEHREKRNQELMGKYLRLEEDYLVLEARTYSDPVSFDISCNEANGQKDHFVVVLLEGEGRMVRSFKYLILISVRCWSPQEGCRRRYATSHDLIY